MTKIMVQDETVRLILSFNRPHESLNRTINRIFKEKQLKTKLERTEPVVGKR